MAPFNSFKRETGERLSAIETHVDNIYAAIADLRDNHIAHLGESIKNIEQLVVGRPTWMISIIITILTAVVAALLGAHYAG